MRHLLLALLCWLAFAPDGQATPFYSVNAGGSCDACHIEPLGWKNPKLKDRRCTLDCKGCHISPTGGGLRTPSGRYFGMQTLPLFGEGPGDGVDAMKYLPKGFPSKGTYGLRDGFSGWWPGSIDHRTIDERYGHLNATPKLSAGGDLRLMSLGFISTTNRELVAFPMEAQLYVAVKPTPTITAYADLGVRGSQTGFAGETPATVFWAREIFLMKDDLPYNAYIRAGRFSLPFGWRVPDHSALIRADFFDQFRQAYGVEIGAAPNESWANIALWRQGFPGWPGDFSPGGVGLTAQGGLRRLGFQLGGSVHAMKADQGQSELAAGPMWGLNLSPITYLGELDVRQLLLGEARTNSLATLHELRLSTRQSITPTLRWEALIQDLNDPQNSIVHRVQAGAVIDLYKFVQLEADLRVSRGGGLNEIAALLQLHLWVR